MKAGKTKLARRIVIAVVGGEVMHALRALGVAVRRFDGSDRGQRTSAIAAIGSDTLAGVVIWARWLGHDDSDAVRRACCQNEVPHRVVIGGTSAVARSVRALVEELSSHVE